MTTHRHNYSSKSTDELPHAIVPPAAQPDGKASGGGLPAPAIEGDKAEIDGSARPPSPSRFDFAEMLHRMGKLL